MIVDAGTPAIKADAMCSGKRNIRPSDVDVDDNVVVASKAPAMEGTQGDRWRGKNNEIDGDKEGQVPPGAAKRAGAATRGADGVARAASPKGPNAGKAPKNALTAADVGPSWWKK